MPRQTTEKPCRRPCAVVCVLRVQMFVYHMYDARVFLVCIYSYLRIYYTSLFYSTLRTLHYTRYYTTTTILYYTTVHYTIPWYTIPGAILLLQLYSTKPGTNSTTVLPWYTIPGTLLLLLYYFVYYTIPGTILPLLYYRGTSISYPVAGANKNDVELRFRKLLC